MAIRNENNYFIMLEKMAECSCRAAEKLEDILTHFDPERIEEVKDELHAIESEGDSLKHQLVEKLVKEFITPIDREDIMAITSQVDDVTDAVEDVILKIYMFNIQTIHPEAVKFAGIVRQCCEKLRKIFSEFSDFNKSKTIKTFIIELNALEEDGDALYMSSVRTLFTGDLERRYAWTEVYNCLEKACDTCENTAELVEHVILKNT